MPGGPEKEHFDVVCYAPWVASLLEPVCPRLLVGEDPGRPFSPEPGRCRKWKWCLAR